MVKEVAPMVGRWAHPSMMYLLRKFLGFDLCLRLLDIEFFLSQIVFNYFSWQKYSVHCLVTPTADIKLCICNKVTWMTKYILSYWLYSCFTPKSWMNATDWLGFTLNLTNYKSLVVDCLRETNATRAHCLMCWKTHLLKTRYWNSSPSPAFRSSACSSGL